MEVSFASNKLQKLCSNAKKMRGEFGPRCSDELQARLFELKAAETLADMRSWPQARCHELSGDRKGQLAVDLEHPQRLIFEPDHSPVPTKPEGGLDWQQVTKVVVLEIVDYHGK